MEEETQGLMILIISCFFVGVVAVVVNHYHPELLEKVADFLMNRPTKF
ncbi:hypothetical protein [Enterococcus sp. DIV1420a]